MNNNSYLISNLKLKDHVMNTFLIFITCLRFIHQFIFYLVLVCGVNYLKLLFNLHFFVFVKIIRFVHPFLNSYNYYNSIININISKYQLWSWWLFLSSGLPKSYLNSMFKWIITLPFSNDISKLTIESLDRIKRIL